MQLKVEEGRIILFSLQVREQSSETYLIFPIPSSEPEASRHKLKSADCSCQVLYVNTALMFAASECHTLLIGNMLKKNGTVCIQQKIAFTGNVYLSVDKFSVRKQR